jgi:hypothetical protein
MMGSFLRRRRILLSCILIGLVSCRKRDHLNHTNDSAGARTIASQYPSQDKDAMLQILQAEVMRLSAESVDANRSQKVYDLRKKIREIEQQMENPTSQHSSNDR